MKHQHLLIDKLGSFLGFEPDRECLKRGLLEVDSLRFQVTQIDTDEMSFVAIAVEVFQIKPEALEGVLTLAMSANHFWRGTQGSTFSYDPMSRRLFLSIRFEAREVEALPEFEIGASIMTLYDSASYWQAVIPQLEIQCQEDFDHKSAYALSFGQTAARFQ